MQWKKFIIAMVTSILLIGVCLMETVSAYSIAEEYASAAEYTAENLINGMIDPETGDISSSTSITRYTDVINREYDYEAIAEAVMGDEVGLVTSTMWDTLTKFLDGQMSAIDGNLRQEQVYEIFLIDYLTYSEGSTQNTTVLDKAGEMADTTLKYEKKIFDKLIEAGIAVDEDSLIELIESSDSLENEDIKNVMEELGFLEDLKEYSTLLDDINTVATTAKDYFDAVSKAMALKEVNDSRIQFLKDMAENADDNTAFTIAVNSIISTIESSYADIAFSEGYKTMASYAISTLWDSAKGSMPFVSTIATTKEALNFLFNSDEMAENKLRIVMQYTAGQYALRTLNDAYYAYMKNPTEETAQAFNEAYKNYLAYQGYSSEWAKEYVEAVPFTSDTTIEAWLNALNADINYCNQAVQIADKYSPIYNNIAYGTSEPSADDSDADSDTSADNAAEIEDHNTNTSYRGTYAITEKFTLKGDMTINGDLYISAGVNIATHTLTVNGDLIVTSNGYIDMDNSDDKINVHGNFITKSSKGTGSSLNYFDEGTLSIDGNLYQYIGSDYNFYCYDGFNVKFVGSGSHTISSQSSLTKIPAITLSQGSSVSFNGGFAGYSSIGSLTFTSDDTSVASAGGSYIKSKGTGSTKVKLRDAEDKVKYTINVTVEESMENTGDVNYDGQTSVADVVKLQKCLVKFFNMTKQQFLNADINKDGKLNVFDVIMLKRQVVNS